MITRIHKWGNSLGLRIPKVVAQEVDLTEGTPVEVQARSGRVVVTPVQRKRYSLEDLLAGIKPSNVHVEWDQPDQGLSLRGQAP